MGLKLIVLGNVLMSDDGIGIDVAKQIEEELTDLGIEVIYGETDIGYCINMVSEKDNILILDAGCNGNRPGEVILHSFPDNSSMRVISLQHSISFLSLLNLYYPDIHGHILAIEADEVQFGFGISPKLARIKKQITEEVLHKISYLVNNT